MAVSPSSEQRKAHAEAQRQLTEHGGIFCGYCMGRKARAELYRVLTFPNSYNKAIHFVCDDENCIHRANNSVYAEEWNELHPGGGAG